MIRKRVPTEKATSPMCIDGVNAIFDGTPEEAGRRLLHASARNSREMKAVLVERCSESEFTVRRDLTRRKSAWNGSVMVCSCCIHFMTKHGDESCRVFHVRSGEIPAPVLHGQRLANEHASAYGHATCFSRFCCCNRPGKVECRRTHNVTEQHSNMTRLLRNIPFPFYVDDIVTSLQVRAITVTSELVGEG
jgi:hypothetical protein